MRTAALLCRRLSSMASQGSFRPMVRNTLARAGARDASSYLLSSPVWCRGTGTVRFMGFGTFNEEHANAVVPEDEHEDEVDDDEHPSVAIEKASHELFKQSNSVVDFEGSDQEDFQVKDLGREKPGADIANEIWSAKEQDGTSVFSDESDKVTSNT